METHIGKFSLTHEELNSIKHKVYSQGFQDGVLEAIFNQIGEGNKTFIEFGARDGVEISNTFNLRLNHGWGGLLMDSEPLSELVMKETITRENINQLFRKYAMYEADYLSIDLDGNDWYVWKAIRIKPRVVTIEYNSKFGYMESFAIEYNSEHKWQGDDYYGASLLALKKLGIEKGYTLVHRVAQFDAVFVRNDLLAPDYIPPLIQELLPKAIIAHDTVSNKKWVEI